jgi:tRNA threonylcarbamoyladenosine biosynthesis protein TsaE
MELTTKGSGETKAFGKSLAADITSGKTSHVLALTGDLGSGKTTFVQGLARGLGVEGRVISPTFILMRKYEIKNPKSKIKTFYHVDLYRLEENLEQEILNLGLPYLWSDPENAVVIEWAEKIKNLIPNGSTWVSFENLGEDERRISLK